MKSPSVSPTLQEMIERFINYSDFSEFAENMILKGRHCTSLLFNYNENLKIVRETKNMQIKEKPEKKQEYEEAYSKLAEKLTKK